MNLTLYQVLKLESLSMTESSNDYSILNTCLNDFKKVYGDNISHKNNMIYISDGGGTIDDPKNDDMKMEFEFKMLKNE